MRVLSVPSDRSGCGLYRSFLPAAATGVQVERGFPVRFDRSGNVVDAWADADVVHVHRPMSRNIVTALSILQSKGVAVSVDIDDDLTAIPKGIPSWDPAQPHVNPDENWQWFTKAARAADMVTVSTPPLLDVYGKHGRAVVVENCVSADWLGADRTEGDPLVVGWSGSPSHHPFDLEQTGGMLAGALEASGARFHTVGSAETLDRVGVEGTWEPWVPIGEYHGKVAEFDVGIVPLADTRFNRSKSWLKGLELAALGVPFVASPTVEYRRLGAGLLAKRPRDWDRQVRRLLSDETLRAEVAEAGREVAGCWTVERHGHRWVEAWELALENRRRRASVCA